MIFAAEAQTRAVLQLGKDMHSIASSLRAAQSNQFVYTPSNASSMRDPNFKLELIKVRISMFGVIGLQLQVLLYPIASDDLCAGLSAKLL